MRELRYVLVSEGSADRALLPILDWVLEQQNMHSSQTEDEKWPDLRNLSQPPQELYRRIEKALELSACELLFIHRDADNDPYETRKQWVLEHLDRSSSRKPAVCVVPVRMQEAWLLTSEQAIRYAANNMNGRARLNLPRLRELEREHNPKDTLKDLILAATELTGQRRERFRKAYLRQAPHRIAEYIKENEGFASLRHLNAFQQLEADLQQLIDEQNWRST